MNNIDPELLKLILANGSAGGYDIGRGNYTGPQISEANDGSGNLDNFEQAIYGNGVSPNWKTNGWDVWNMDGTYRGHGTGDSDAMSALKFAALAAAGYFGGSALAGAGEGAGAVSGMDLAADGMATYGGGAGAAGAGGAASSGLGGGGLGGSGLSTSQIASGVGSAGSLGDYSNEGRNYPNTASTQGSGGSPVNASTGGLDWGKLASQAAGTIAGAASGGDQQQTTSRDPWAPAQPFLKGLLGDAQSLWDQYKANPLSEQQKQAYGNSFGLLNYANETAPSLLAAAQNNAAGKNNYSRLGGRATGGLLATPNLGLVKVGNG